MGGELGQVQPDQGNGHVQAGDKVTYPVCPPASGKHINQPGFGPLEPKVYGPDDASLPNGWVHNLEHGGLVLLYSCEKGACDAAGIQAPARHRRGLPDQRHLRPARRRRRARSSPGSSRCPRKYAALVWDRVLYLDTLDSAKIYDFYLRYGERVSDGTVRRAARAAVRRPLREPVRRRVRGTEPVRQLDRSPDAPLRLLRPLRRRAVRRARRRAAC